MLMTVVVFCAPYLNAVVISRRRVSLAKQCIKVFVFFAGFLEMVGYLISVAPNVKKKEDPPQEQKTVIHTHEKIAYIQREKKGGEKGLSTRQSPKL